MYQYFKRQLFYTITCISRKIKVINLKMHGENMKSHQHVSAGIPAIFRVMFLYKNTKIEMWLTVSPSLHNN